MEIRHRRPRWAPGGIKPRLRGTLGAKKVHPPRTGRVKCRRQALHRQRQLRLPNFLPFLNAHSSPQSALQIALSPRRDVQINPLAVGADFNFLVTPLLRIRWLEKHFRDVPVPKVVASSVRLRIFEDRDVPIARHELHKQKFRTPEQPHFGPESFIGILALPIVAKLDRRCAPPSGLARQPIFIHLSNEARRHNLTASPR